MASELTPEQREAHKAIEDATTRAMENPRELADFILRGINDQTTSAERTDFMEHDSNGHAETEVPETTRGVSESGFLTRDEIITGLDKPPTKIKLPRNLPAKGHLIEETAPSLTVDNLDEGLGNDDDMPTSEASEVASMVVQMRETTGLINSLDDKLSRALSGIESRLSTLESRLARSDLPATTHKRVVSGPIIPVIPPALPSMSGALQTNPNLSDLGELLERCKGHKYTPSKLAQRQIFISLAEGKDIGDIDLPLSRSQWKPENLVRIVLGFN